MQKTKISGRILAILVSLCLALASVIPAAMISVSAEDTAAEIGTATYSMAVVDSDGNAVEEIQGGDQFSVQIKLTVTPADADNYVGVGGLNVSLYFDSDQISLDGTDYAVGGIDATSKRDANELTLVAGNPNDGQVNILEAQFSAKNNTIDLNDYVIAEVYFKANDALTTENLSFALTGLNGGSANVFAYTDKKNENNISVYDYYTAKIVSPITVATDYAPSTTPTGSLTASAVQDGTTVTVTVSGTSSTAATAVQYGLNYDSDKLEYVGTTKADANPFAQFVYTDTNLVTGTLLNAMTFDTTGTGTQLADTALATHTFNVIGTGDTTISFKDGSGNVMTYYDTDSSKDVAMDLTTTPATLTLGGVEVTEIAISPNTASLYTNDGTENTATLSVTETPAENTNDLTYVWKSSDETVATVDESGVVTAVGPGTATITATASNDLTASAAVNVATVDFSDLEAASGALTGKAGATYTLASPKVTGVSTESLTYTWASDNEAVATVDDNGTVTLVGDGTANITVTASNGASYTKPITVTVLTDPNGSLTMSVSPASAQAGDEVTVTVYATSSEDASALQYQIAYDTDKLQYVSYTKADANPYGNFVVTDTDKVSTAGLNSMAFTTSGTGSTLSNTEIATYTFKVVATDEGDASFSFTDDDALTLMTRYDSEAAEDVPMILTTSGASLIITEPTEPVHVTSIAFDQESVDLSTNDGAANTTTLTITETPAENDDDLTYTYTSSDPSVATVDKNGVVTAVGPGTATITVTGTCTDGTEMTDTAEVNVSHIDFSDFNDNDNEIGLEAGETTVLKGATTEGASSEGITYTWTSSDPSVATVDETGTITAVGNGTTTITLTASNGATATKDITVKILVPVDSIIADQTTVDLSTDGDTTSETITITESPANNTDELTYTYTSSDPSVATVDENGVVTAVGPGTATITAIASNGMEVTTTVNVSEVDFSDLEAASGNVAANVGDTEQLPAPTVNGTSSTPITFTYTSSDPSVLTVDENGVVTVVGNGTATVTVTSSTGASTTKDFTVSAYVPATGVTPSATDIGLTTNETGKNSAALPTVTTDPADSTSKIGDYTWTSSDPSVAKIEDGKVIAVGDGTATLTAVVPVTDALTGETTEYTITVPVSVYTAVVDSDAVFKDFSGTNSSTIDTKDYITTGSEENVTFSVSDSSIATIDENGILTFLKSGTVTVTYTFDNGQTFTKEFTATNVPEQTTSGGENSSTTSGTVKTGDQSGWVLWAVIAMLALAGAGTGVVVLKKKAK